MGLRDLVRSLERLEPLDAVADWLAPRVVSVLGQPTLKDVLSGTWLGHPLHPMLTDLALGAWASAGALDVLGGEEAAEAATTLVGLGVVAALPTAASGLSDWSDTVGPERRLGLVHAGVNSGALAMYSASFVARSAGCRRSGIGLGMLGAGLALAGGYLGGHLSFARGIGVDHTIFDEAPEEWAAVARDAEVGDGETRLVTAAGFGVLLHRRGRALHAIAARCTHAGGPLQEGEVDDQMCVTCPWHGSRFRLVDGSVARGPATAPQRAFDVRVRDGAIEVKARAAR